MEGFNHTTRLVEYIYIKDAFDPLCQSLGPISSLR